MTDKTGGAAFPIPATGLHGTHTGMSLRDYLAAKAMQGDWATERMDSGYWSQDDIDAIFKDKAETYYRMADAMLKARSNK
ncbi:hypothetical protein [Providencia sp. CIM-Carb-044]|uniref:hypothetical protein n=1 Tax=Providencia sp. CIM-Carb-044 TaxID=3096048 RepID=UPI0024AA7C8A|nr:hypothetical protein [Providencia sp. CIM-Carb-044]MCK9787996.1 hypothetical protein [Providencia rettgeri]MDX7424308.1 hypothetical protein [Providencia sp. CIM-Carb-044]